MVVRAVRCVLDGGLVEHVVVLGVDRGIAAVARACTPPARQRAAGRRLPVRTHVDQRAGRRTGDDRSPHPVSCWCTMPPARWPRPGWWSPSLDAVRGGHDAAAVPVLPMTDTVKRVDAAGLVRWLARPRRPARRADPARAIRYAPSRATPADRGARLPARGARCPPCPGDPLAFAVRTAWDLELAELLLTDRVGP